MKRWAPHLRLAFLAVLVTFFVTPVLAQGEATRKITNIAGDLYRFQNNFHYSVFLVTPDGIIATDPITPEAARWLKAELASRFKQPVKYVIYSHHHADHVSGGEVFADTAIFVGHENMIAAAAEQGVAEVRPPDIVYSDTMKLTLGGKTVELHYVGKNHSDNMTVVRFPDEKTVFTVDFISANRLPYRTLGDTYYPDLITSIKAVEAMDFKIVAPGHGALGTRQDLENHRQYHEDLTSAVQAQISSGKTVEESKAAIKLDKYKDWAQYDAWLGENIEGAFRILSGGN
jgi:glyoxylase-like metal-dependent hydrolase (beta-lactamase superfamily II)